MIALRIAILSVALWRHLASEHFIEEIRRDERVLVVNVGLSVDILDEEPPEAGNDVRDHEYDDDETEDLVGVHHHVLGLDTVGPR